jgi:hypothetical protein
MKGNIISPRAFSASIRIARPRAEITSGGSMMAVSQRITARIFVVGGKHRATTLVEGGDIGVDRAFVGLVVPFTCDGHAAFGNEALRAVFKDFQTHSRLLRLRNPESPAKTKGRPDFPLRPQTFTRTRRRRPLLAGPPHTVLIDFMHMANH